MGDQIKELSEKTEKAKQDLKDRIANIESRQKAYEEKALSALTGGPSIFTPSRSGNSFEAKVLKSFGASSVKDLLSTNIGHPRFSNVDYAYRHAALQLKEAIDVSRWISQIFHGEARDVGDMSQNPAIVKGVLEHRYGREVLAPLLKSFGSGTSTTGGNWIPTGISTQFEEEFELERKWLSVIQEIAMPTDPWKLPVQTNVTIARKATENTAMTDSNFQTTTIDFDAFKLSEFYALGEELNEDSAPAILALARAEVVEAQLRARETILANGDNTAPHMDSDTTTADLAVKQVKGFRKLGLANSANGGDVNFGGAAVTTAKLDEMRTNMGKFGVNVRDLVLAFGPTGYNQALSLAEVSSVEKFGAAATILTGALAAFRGIPVVVSDFVRENLNASGVHDGVTTDRTVCYLVHKKRFWFGIRRPIKSKVMMDLAQQDRWLLASYSRIDFKGHTQSASEVSVVVGRNILV